MKKSPRKKKIFKPLHEVCPFCESKTEPDYKDAGRLSEFLTDRARIYPASRSGVCSKHQRALAREIKYARFLALLPFTEKIK
jgi:small subunit ribosomal protein S18